MSAGGEDEELAAIQQVIGALTPLQADARERVIQYVFQRLGIQDAPPPPAALREAQPDTTAAALTAATPGSPQRQADIRTFATEKAPRSANEMAALVAYYLAELAPPSDRKSEVSAADIEKYFKQAAFRLPAAARFTLTNAKAAGYLDAGSSRGTYRLNPVGHNLVAHGLPSGESTARAPSRAPAKRKKSAAKKKSSKKKAAKKKRGSRR